MIKITIKIIACIIASTLGFLAWLAVCSFTYTTELSSVIDKIEYEIYQWLNISIDSDD